MRYYPIRVLMRSSKQTVYGITLPAHLAVKFSGVTFSVIVNGENIVLESGCNYEERKKQIPNITSWQ